MTNNVVASIQGALASFGPLIGDAISGYALITPGGRSIGSLFPHVVVEETHNDELTITQHPVEFGTPVTDHAFMQPYTVEIRCGWSNSTAATSGYVQAVYQALLALQTSRTPFAISTGKRQYKSMLLRTVLVKTDPDSENTLMCVATAQQIVITSPAMAAGTPANTNGATAAPVSQGTNSSDPQSILATQGVGNIAPGSNASAFTNNTWPNDVSPTSGGGAQSLFPSATGSSLQTLQGQWATP